LIFTIGLRLLKIEAEIFKNVLVGYLVLKCWWVSLISC